MSPLIPTDPVLVLTSLDRSSVGTPAVLVSYLFAASLLLLRGMKRSWLTEPPAPVPEPDADSEDHDTDAENAFPERREETLW